MQKMNWQRLFKLRTADIEFKSKLECWSPHNQSDNKDGRAYIQSSNEHRRSMNWCGTRNHPLSRTVCSPDYIDVPLEQYDGIAHVIPTALAEGQHTDPDKSVLTWASIKLDHPETYAGGSDIEEFEIFVAGILRWLKMNCLLGETSIDMQVDYLGTHLIGEAQEWFYRNVEWVDRQVHDWTLETVVQGLQRRFLHTLTHHHASNKFDTVSQGTKTSQEVLNDLKKYAAWMIHL